MWPCLSSGRPIVSWTGESGEDGEGAGGGGEQWQQQPPVGEPEASISPPTTGPTLLSFPTSVAVPCRRRARGGQLVCAAARVRRPTRGQSAWRASAAGYTCMTVSARGGHRPHCPLTGRLTT